MKKSIWAVFGLLISTLIWAANSDIKMVTYFPTRYMIYQDVTVKGPMEVGIGQYDEDKVQLDVAKDVTMTHGRVADSTTLTLTGADINSSSKYGQRITSGSGSTDTRGTLQFDGGVTVPATGLSSGVQSIETDHKATLTALTLGTKGFPACDDGNGGHNISWQKLTIDNKGGVFLVCGTGETLEQSCDENPNQQKCCPKCYRFQNGQCTDPCEGTGKTLRTRDCKCVDCAHPEIDTEEECRLPGNMGYYGYMNSDGCCICDVNPAYNYNTSRYKVGSKCFTEPFALYKNDDYDMPTLTGTVTQLSFDTNTCRWVGLCEIPNYLWKSVSWSPAYDQQNEHCYPLGATKTEDGITYTCKEVGLTYSNRFQLGSHDYTAVRDSSWLDY